LLGGGVRRRLPSLLSTDDTTNAAAAAAMRKGINNATTSDATAALLFPMFVMVFAASTGVKNRWANEDLPTVGWVDWKFIPGSEVIPSLLI
jgi:hypothetical protein